MSWEQAWREGRTPWDAGQSSPALEALVSKHSLPSGRALVPGAGSGYDVLALAGPTRQVVGLDLAEAAQARFEELRRASGVPAEQAELVVTDFFAYEPATPFDLWWDYTFLCAIDLDDRPRWADQVDRLLGPRGELVVLVFPLRSIRDGGDPPHPISVELIAGLLSGRFECTSVVEPETSHPGRAGNEVLARFQRIKS